MQTTAGKTASDIRKHPMLLTVPEMLFAFLSILTCLLYTDGVRPDSIPPDMQRMFLLSFLFIGLMRFFRAAGNRYGIIVVALITSIIVNFYGEIKKAGTGQEKDKAKSEE